VSAKRTGSHVNHGLTASELEWAPSFSRLPEQTQRVLLEIKEAPTTDALKVHRVGRRVECGAAMYVVKPAGRIATTSGQSEAPASQGVGDSLCQGAIRSFPHLNAASDHCFSEPIGAASGSWKSRVTQCGTPHDTAQKGRSRRPFIISVTAAQFTAYPPRPGAIVDRPTDRRAHQPVIQ